MGLQLRRGIDSDRTGITPAQGEPIYVTDTGKLYIGDGVTPGGVLVSGDVSDSAGVTVVINQVVDSAYVQARQTDFFRDSAFVTDIVDAAYIQARDRIRDSGFVEDIVDSAFVQARQITYDFLDSAEAINLIDSAYINARTDANIDSVALIAVVDSAYVQARQTPQDFAYSSLTGAPTNVSSFTNDANYLDSSTVVGVITAAYIQANQTTYNTADFTDSTYVANEIQTAINNLIDGAPGTLDTLNEIAAALNDDDSAYATLVGLINDQLDSAEVTALIDAAYVQARQITYNTSDFTDSAFVTGLPVSTFTNDANYLDSTTVQGVIDATYIQANQTTYTNVSEFNNDANYLDSTTATVLIDSAYINARTDANIDSVALIALVDSAYVQARQAPGTDSAAVTSLITTTVDSAYVNARVSTVDSGQVLNIVELDGYTKLDSTDVINLLPDGTYRGLRTFVFTADSGDTTFTGVDDFGNTLLYSPQNLVVYANGILLVDSADYTATNGTTISLVQAADSADVITVHNIVAGGLDSAAALELVIDGTYRGLRTYTFTADSGDTAFTGTDDFGNTLAYSRQSLVVYVNGILLTDSVDYTALDGSTITLTNPADSADVITFHNIVAGGQVDSALVNQLLLTGVDSAYVQARQTPQDFAYSSLTGAPTNISSFTNDANYLDSTSVTGVIDATYIQANQTTYDFLDSAEAIALIDSAYIQARQDFAYSSLTGAPTNVSSFTNDANYLDSTTVTGVIDATYIQANQTTYDFLDSAEAIALIDSAYVQARQSNPDQSLNTTDSVVFNTLTTTGNVIVGGNLQVTGTTTTVNSEDLNVTDHMIYMNAGESAGSPTASIDVGWAANVNDDGSYAHVGMFRDATDNAFKVFEGYTPEPDAAAEINTGHASFSLAPFAARTLTGQYLGFDSDFNTKTISDLVNDANYLDSTTVTDVIDATYIQANQTTYDFLDSAEAIALITGSDLNMGTNKILYSNVYDSIGALPSASSYHGMFAHVHATGAAYYAHAGSWIQLANNSDLSTYGNSDVISLVDSAYVQARQTAGTDSAATIALITATVDSAYVALREANAGGSSGTDSATVITLVQSTVDSDYVLARIPDATLQGVNQFEFLADSGQTVFTGADRDGNSLTYNTTDVLVFLNGTLMVPGNDFNTTNSNTITFTEGVDSGDFVNIFNFTAGRAVGGGVSEVNHFDFTADSGQTAFTGSDDNGSILSFIGNDNIQVFINGILLKQSDYTISNNNTVTLTDGADSADEVRIIAYDTYSQRVAIDTYNFTADSGQTVFTGLADDGNTLVFSPGNLQVHLNGIMLRSGNDFSTSGTGTVTLVSGADSGDTLTVTAISGDSAGYATIVPAIVDSAYINARVTIPAAGTDSADVVNIITAEGFTKYDSNDTIGLVDSAYVQARQITYSTANFADSAFVTAQINALIDGAPGTLDTLNEIAAALNDDDSAYTTLVNLINTKSNLDSADAINLIDSAHVQARQDYAYSSLTGTPTAVSSFTNDANYLDSTTVTGVIDAAYIQANQTTYDFLDSAEAIALIATQGYLTDAIDSARITSMLAADSFSIGGTIIGDGKIEIKNTTGSTPSYVDLYCEVSNAHYTRIQSEAHANYSGNVTLTTPTTSGTLALTSDIVDSAAIITLIQANDQQRDSAFVTGIIDSAYIATRTSAGTDSASVIALITSTVDSAYVALREANAGGSGGSVDSAVIISLIQSTVDSAYVTARDPGGSGGVTFKTFQYLADSGQTIFTGTDDLGNSLAFVPDQYQVYRNGILLIDSADYNGTGGGTITLTDTSVTGDQITIATYTATVGSSISTYDYFADSGQTSFSGADIDGNTLSFTGSNVLVHVNGLLLTDSNDYTRVGGSTITFDNGLDSGDVVSIIAVTDAVSSGSGGTDSATVLSLIQGLVDSAYVQARQSLTTGLLVDTYSYTADSAQTVFSGADNASNTLKYTAGEIQVFRNGILLVDSDDYTASNGTSITLTSGANLGDNLSVTAFSSADQIVQLNTFEYTADSGATSFSGTDDFGNSLTYNVGNILVHLNGILLTDSADYTANNGTTVVLSTAADSADILHISAFGTATALNKWRETAVSYTTEAGTKLIVDTSSGIVTVTLPASPVFGDEVKIIDGTGNAASNNITINRNGNKILGADSDFTIDVNRTAVDLVYYNASNGWIISGNT